MVFDWKQKNPVVAFGTGDCIYAEPIGEHFYRVSIQYRAKTEEVVATMICGECQRIFELAYKEGDTVDSTVKCPYCDFTEEIG